MAAGRESPSATTRTGLVEARAGSSRSRRVGVRGTILARGLLIYLSLIVTATHMNPASMLSAFRVEYFVLFDVSSGIVHCSLDECVEPSVYWPLLSPRLGQSLATGPEQQRKPEPECVVFIPSHSTRGLIR